MTHYLLTNEGKQSLSKIGELWGQPIFVIGAPASAPMPKQPMTTEVSAKSTEVFGGVPCLGPTK